MIDTVQIRQRAQMHGKEGMIALNFRSSCGHDESSRYFLNLPNKPRLTWSRTESGDWLSAEVSLPKFYFGDNVQSLNQKQLETALSDVKAYIEEAAAVDFDVSSALVGRVDYGHNFRLDSESDVRKYIRTFQKVRLSRYDTQAVNDETVTLYAKSRQTCIYSKYYELSKDKDVDKKLLDSASGILRIEPRYRVSASVTALAERFNTERTVSNLLTEKVSKRVMKMELQRIGADKPVLTCSQRERKLVELFGINKAARLSGILGMRDNQGESFVKSHLPRSTYQRIKKELEDVGLWFASEEVHLPGLKIE